MKKVKPPRQKGVGCGNENSKTILPENNSYPSKGIITMDILAIKDIYPNRNIIVKDIIA